MINSRVSKQVSINNIMVQKALSLSTGALLKGRGGQNRAAGSTETGQCK